MSWGGYPKTVWNKPPWKLSGYRHVVHNVKNADHAVISDANGWEFCHVFGANQKSMCDTAKLIALAPQMNEAIRELMEILDSKEFIEWDKSAGLNSFLRGGTGYQGKTLQGPKKKVYEILRSLEGTDYDTKISRPQSGTVESEVGDS